MVLYEKLKSKMDNNPYSKNILKTMENHNNNIIIGLTKISLADDILRVEHSGSDGHTIDDVNWNLLDVDLPSTAALKELFNVLTEQGNPDWYYVMQVQL